MAGLQDRVKNALDEARILVLGSQVLLGFQFRAFFEQGWEKLSPVEKWCEIAGLFALLLTLGGLFLPAARHRIVERGNDSERVHRFVMGTMRAVLLPFGLGLSLDVGVAADRIVGPLGGTIAATLCAITVFAFWYGHYTHASRLEHKFPEDHVEKTSLDHRIVQVLTETRVVIPGAQALLGFQLAMVLMESFEKLPKAAKLVHLASLGFTTLATIVLMSVAAYHRIVDRGENTERFHAFASKMILLALALFAPGFALEVYVVLSRAGLPTLAPVASGTTLVVFYAGWFGAMVLLRRRRAGRLPQTLAA